MIIKLDRTGFKRRLWQRAYEKLLSRMKSGEGEQDQQFKQFLFYGIKYYGIWFEKSDDLNNQSKQMTLIVSLMRTFTPRQFMEMFPIDKTYDGERYEMKDYYSCMESIHENGIDELIKEPFEFLWDYWNWDTSRFLMNYMSVMSDLRKLETGIGIVEEFFQNEGLTFYEE